MIWFSPLTPYCKCVCVFLYSNSTLYIWNCYKCIGIYDYSIADWSHSIFHWVNLFFFQFGLVACRCRAIKTLFFSQSAFNGKRNLLNYNQFLWKIIIIIIKSNYGIDGDVILCTCKIFTIVSFPSIFLINL